MAIGSVVRAYRERCPMGRWLLTCNCLKIGSDWAWEMRWIGAFLRGVACSASIAWRNHCTSVRSMTILRSPTLFRSRMAYAKWAPPKPAFRRRELCQSDNWPLACGQ